MDLVYVNRTPGRQRIHVEIDLEEIAELLDDLLPLDHDAWRATKQLVAILVDSRKELGEPGRPAADEQA